MSDKEMNEIRVSVCNSLNAQAWRYKYSDPRLSSLLLRSQESINKLLDEIERLNDCESKYFKLLAGLVRLKDENKN